MWSILILWGLLIHTIIIKVTQFRFTHHGQKEATCWCQWVKTALHLTNFVGMDLMAKWLRRLIWELIVYQMTKPLIIWIRRMFFSLVIGFSNLAAMAAMLFLYRSISYINLRIINDSSLSYFRGCSFSYCSVLNLCNNWISSSVTTAVTTIVTNSYETDFIFLRRNKTLYTGLDSLTSGVLMIDIPCFEDDYGLMISELLLDMPCVCATRCQFSTKWVES